uniref:Uncharacterized protein n=1 Tax=Denticeps clupeoides TaxID=299321 RepID=A0AAY4AGE5_9TELE
TYNLSTSQSFLSFFYLRRVKSFFPRHCFQAVTHIRSSALFQLQHATYHMSYTHYTRIHTVICLEKGYK